MCKTHKVSTMPLVTAPVPMCLCGDTQQHRCGVLSVVPPWRVRLGVSRTQRPKRGRLAGGVVSGDSDILLLLWALPSGVPAAASCAQSKCCCAVPGCPALAIQAQDVLRDSLFRLSQVLCRSLNSLWAPRRGTAMPEDPACTAVGLEYTCCASHGSGRRRKQEARSCHRLWREPAPDAQHELDWVWAGRSAHGSGHILYLRLRGGTVPLWSILLQRLALFLSIAHGRRKDGKLQGVQPPSLHCGTINRLVHGPARLQHAVQGCIVCGHKHNIRTLRDEDGRLP